MLENSNFLIFYLLLLMVFFQSEINRIVENAKFYLIKGINIFGIDVGVSPFGIERLFGPIPNYN